MSRRKRRSRKYSDAYGKRHRSNVVANTVIHCGDNYFTVDGGRNWIFTDSVTYDPTMFGRPYKSAFGLDDECHPGPPYHEGGPFSKFTYEDPFALTSAGTFYGWLFGSIGYKYVGGFVPQMRSQDFDFAWTPGDIWDATGTGYSALRNFGDVSSYGATGWNKFRPGNPTADLGVFLGELRDVPRMLQGTAKAFHDLWRGMGGSLSGFKPKSVADHWLNTQFGWRPFISDLRKFYRTYTQLDEMLNRIIKNNGRWMRRGGTVTSDEESVVISSDDHTTGHWPVLASPFYPSYSNSGSRTLSVVKRLHVWFEGAFRYWIPDVGSVPWRRRAIVELFGAMPCPSLVWNLIPWSWLVDWCSNVGDVISNMSTGYADNLAAKYAYVMGHTQRVGRLDSTCLLLDGTLHNSWSFPLEWKTRVAASPFGFGLSNQDFSVRQLSILAALGISRLKLR